MIGKTNSKQGAPAAQETVNIRLISNQSEHSGLVGTKFTLSYGMFKREYTWGGNEVSAQIPAHVTYSVEFGGAEGYNTPEPIIYEAVEDNARTIEAIYTCELLTVNVGADEGTPEGYEVAIYKGSKIDLPSGYTFLEYIESSGTQYIDTGFKPNQDTRVVIDCELSTQDSYPKAIFGGRNNNTSVVNSFTFWAISNSGFRSEYGSAYKTISITPVGRFVIDKNKATTTINGSATTNTSATFQSDYNLVIFSLMRPSGVDSRAASMKVYSCQIYDNGILIRDYVPAKNSSGVAGLYDIANGVFYKSASTTDFVAGSEIANPFTWLEYIESNGSQYIDTEFKPNNNTRVLLDLETLSNISSTVSFFGARTAANSKNFAMLYVSSSGKLRSDYNNLYTSEFDFKIGRFTIDKNKETTIVDGKSLSYSNTSFQCDYNMFIFANNNAGSTSWISTYRLYSCQIYDNGTLVRDYIPASRYDGSVGLYDKVNSKFYSSVSGTNFIAGDEVNLAGETIAVLTTATGSYRIPFGTEYSISASKILGFKEPTILNFTANQQTRFVNIEYLKKLGTLNPTTGVWIQDIEGYCHTYEEWDNTLIPNGIAVISNNSNFVISLVLFLHTSMATGDIYGDPRKMYAPVTNLGFNMDNDKHISHYDGKGSTNFWMNTIGSEEFYNEYRVKFVVYNDCLHGNIYSYIFPNGKSSYIPAYGQYSIIKDNFSIINQCLRKCGGTEFTVDYLYSSISMVLTLIFNEEGSVSSIDMISMGNYFGEAPSLDTRPYYGVALTDI